MEIWGNALQENFWNLEALHFGPNTMPLGGQTTSFHMHEYPPFLPNAPYSTGSSFLIIH